MSIIKDKANLIAADMERNSIERRVAFDPTIIITVAQVIYYLIKAYKACNQTPKQASISMKNAGILERFRLRRAIRHQINDSEMYEHIGIRMFNSALAVASNTEEHEIQQMYEEVERPLEHE